MSIIPKWLGELKWSDFWGGVKKDTVNMAKEFGGATKAVLGGVRGILSPTIIWLFVIAFVALILWKQFSKTLIKA